MPMAGAHHTAFLLAILIGILLLLFVACILFIFYCREKCFRLGRSQRKSRRLDGLTREQATSMTSVSRNFLDPPTLSFYDPQHFQQFSCPLTESIVSQQEDQGTYGTILEMWASRQNEQGDLVQQSSHSSQLPPTAMNECGQSSRSSTSGGMFSSCPLLMESGLRNDIDIECSAVVRSPSRRRSSSMKSQVGSDLLLAPQESTIQDASTSTDRVRVSSQQEPCTVLSETTSDQQFLWRSLTLTSSTSSQNSLLPSSQHSGLVELHNHSRHTESVSVPGTLKRQSCIVMNLEGSSLTGQSLVQVPKTTGLLRPKAWFISLRSTSLPDRTIIEKEDPNNVTSLDSGVDILELQFRRQSGPKKDGVQKPAGQQEPLEGLRSREDVPRCDCEVERLHSSGPGDARCFKGMEEEQPGSEPQTEPLEVEVTLNQAHCGNKRSLWQKREERPLIGIN